MPERSSSGVSRTWKSWASHPPRSEPSSPRAVLQQVEEDVPGFEDAGIVGEEAENDADKELLQIVSLVAGGFERVVEVAHPLGGLNVDGVLILERALLYAEDEAELLHMGGQVFERKGYVLVFVQIVEFETSGNRSAGYSAADRYP